MTFNAQNLISSINKSGVAKSSHFEIEITGFGDTGDERDLLYRAESVEIPGRNMSTIEHKFTNYGPINKVPYGQIYGDTTISFLLSEDMREKEYFEIWQDKMVNTGAFEVGGNRTVGSMHNVKYFDNYAGTVTIRQYGTQGNLHSIHTLIQAYPIFISGVAMEWGSEDVAKMTVTFAYKYYKAVFNKQDQPGLGLGFSFRLDRDGLSGAARIPGIGNIIGSTESGRVQASIGKFAKIRNFL